MELVTNVFVLILVLMLIIMVGVCIFAGFAFTKSVFKSIAENPISLREIFQSRGSVDHGPRITITNLNREYDSLQKSLEDALDAEGMSDEDVASAFLEALTEGVVTEPTESEEELTEKEEEAESEEGEKEERKRMFIFSYEGDVVASQNEDLSNIVTAINAIYREGDEVVVSIESPGGTVPGYGYAASQLQRLKNNGIHLTACVDKIAASGGYMLASVADKIVAAPFSIIGSIGVVAQMPNFHELLKKMGVNYNEYTAGEFKRTVSTMGEITPEKEEKFREQLEDVHQLFKDHILSHRPDIDIEKVSTGEYWHGVRAKDLGLVDEIGTSDDYILSMRDDYDIFMISMSRRLTLRERISDTISLSAEKLYHKIAYKASKGLL
jgi:serine protease SohB